jgi:glycosyl transferase, family 25
MTVKVFIINLKKSTERRRFIQRQLLMMNLDSEFVEACEPDEISDEELDKSELNNHRYVNELNKETIGCAMSHVKALKALAHDESCTHGLIIEDDVILSRNLPQILTRLKKCNELENIVLLYSMVYKPTEYYRELDLCLGYGLVRPSHYEFFGAQAYFLSKDKAKEFSNQLLPITVVADDWKTFMERKYFSKLHLVYPFPVLHAEFLSVRIAPGSAGLRGVIKNLIIKHKIFPFYNIFFGIRRRNAEKRQKMNIHAPSFKSSKTYKL